MPTASEPEPPGRRMVAAMALCSGLAVANIYYNQPMLALIKEQYGSSITWLMPTFTQLGYALGLLLLVPLGDLMERRRLIVTQFVILSVTLVFAALATAEWALVCASLLIGVFATVAQQIVPFAAALSPSTIRGRTIGTVMSGLLCGILLSRVVSGFIASHWGWRSMFWIASPLAILGAGIMRATLPSGRPASELSYPASLASLAKLWVQHRDLRQATATQAALFASFICFWTILSLHLAEPRLGYGAATAGLFGVVGAVGVAIAPVAGHIADRHGPHLVIRAAAAVTVLSWCLFGAWPGIVGLLVGVVLLDIGVQGSLVSNQHVIYALGESTRNRVNTIFMGGTFIGGSLGSAGVSYAWHRGGWRGTCFAGIAFAAVALVIQSAKLHRPRAGIAPGIRR